MTGHTRDCVVELLRCAADLCQRERSQAWPRAAGPVGCLSIAAGALGYSTAIYDLALRAEVRVSGGWVVADGRHQALLEAAARMEHAGAWHTRAFPIEVRIYPDAADPNRWALYSRHREWGTAARKALVEATNGHPTARVELVDSREVRP